MLSPDQSQSLLLNADDGDPSISSSSPPRSLSQRIRSAFSSNKKYQPLEDDNGVALSDAPPRSASIGIAIDEKTHHHPSSLLDDEVNGVFLTYIDVCTRLRLLCAPDPYVPSQTYNPEDFLDRQRKLLVNVTALTCVDGAGKILTYSEPKEGVKSVMGMATCDDLSLISGRGTSAICFAHSIDRTSTLCGKMFLYCRLMRPTRNIPKIINRQKLVKAFCDEGVGDLLGEMEKQFEVMKDNEKHVLGFENSKLALPGRIDKLFWKYQIQWLDNAANKNSLAVSMNAAIETAKAFVATLIQTAAIVVLPAYSISLMGAFPSDMAQFLSDYQRRFAASSGPLYALASITPSDVIRGGMGLLAGAIASISIKTQWKWFFTDLEMEAMLHHKMLAVAKYYRAAKRVHSLLVGCQFIDLSLFEHFKLLDDFLNNKSLRSLFNAFESRTFDGSSKFFFQRGNVLFPWRQMEEVAIRNEFRKAITALSEIDCILSTAKLVREHSNERVKFCFPEFLIGESTPSIDLRDYWHPVVGRQNCVVNSISLGEAFRTPNIIITGPNAGGKSTSLRSITSAVVMGQSLGIAAASTMRFTPFARITSSMSTTDDVGTGDSLFQAQTNFITNLDREMERAPSAHFCLSALDEIFTGTRQDEGAELALATARKLGGYRNGLTMFATHFQVVPELGEMGEQSRYVNHKVTANVVGDKVISPYTLIPGVSDQFLAFEIAAQKGLSKDILMEAKRQKEMRKK